MPTLSNSTFTKPPTSIDQQVELLARRSMVIEDPDAARRWLSTVGYYRLSAYWLPFEKKPPVGAARSKLFVQGAGFSKVCSLYILDRKLRLLVLEAIERVENHARASWTYHMVHEYGSHAHLDGTLFKGAVNHTEQLARLARTVAKSNETCIVHYRGKYEEPYLPPLWAVTEVMTLGGLSKWFAMTKDCSLKSRVGRELGLPTREVAEGALELLAYVRNICAHHGRLWNRRLVKRLPHVKRWREDTVQDAEQQIDNRIFNVLVALTKMLEQHNIDSTWPQRLLALVNTASEEQIRSMGFPGDWRTRPLWSRYGLA